MATNIIFERRGGLGLITIDRPQALNAMNAAMAAAMLAQLQLWADDPAIARVAIQGSGKAFCAGGDIRSVYEMGTDAMRFFTPEYDLCRAIHAYPKTTIALMDGITFGGGVGISIYATHRIATPDTLWAMPECAIGFYPDIGATWFLPRLPGETGTWLALTGARLRADDLLALGIATGFARDVTELLVQLETEIPTTICHPRRRPRTHCADTPTLGVERIDGSSAFAEDDNIRVIDRCFAFDTVEQIIAALQAEPSVFAKNALAAMAKACPTSLKVTLRQMRIGTTLDFNQALQLEHRLTQRFLAQPDFFEGVRALLIDRDNAPRWQPATLAEIDEAAIAAYFAVR